MVWASATLLVAIVVGYLSWVLFMVGPACCNDAPVPAGVRELQAILVVGGLFCAGSCLLLARFTGRWWWRAAVSAAAIAAIPLLIVVSHPTLASWSGSGLCRL